MKTIELDKGDRILKYINRLRDLEEVSVYDDRLGDINSYKNITTKIPKNIVFNIYMAENGNFGLVMDESKIIKLINEEILSLI